jgi:predicted 3-demethylubiquinone-9 3-methyltransferase (glyoxalase superfamily)
MSSRDGRRHHDETDCERTNPMTQMIRPCLWFDTEAEDAAKHYVSIFPNARIVEVARYGEAGPREAGTVMTVIWELDGQEFMGLNGGPEFTFNEAMSLEVTCRDQDEVDYFWDKLGEGGEHGPCGWLKDKFGVSWQITPQRLNELIADPDPHRAQAAIKAMLGMGKIDVAGLERAAESVAV